MTSLSEFQALSYDEKYLGLNIFSTLSEGKPLPSFESELYPGIHFMYGPLSLLKNTKNPLTQSLFLIKTLQGGFSFKLGSHEISILKQDEIAVATTPFVDPFQEFATDYAYGMMFRLDIPVAQTLLNEYLPEARFDLLGFSADVSRCRDVEGLRVCDEIKGLLDDIQELVLQKDLATIKLKTLELLCALSKRQNYEIYRIGTYGYNSFKAATDTLTMLIENPQIKKSVGQLMEEASAPEGSLKRVFVAIAGCGVGGFLKMLRLRKGALLLRTRLDLSISAIALAIGYSNASKFSATFKDVFGYKPLQYRKLFMFIDHSR